MTDLNEVKAGRYELVVHQFDQITSAPNEPFAYTRYRAGDIVDLNVEDARRLVAAGAVVEPGVRERAAAQAARAAYEAALAALPDEVRAELLSGNVTNVGPTGDDDPTVQRPADGAKKAVWVDYAVSQGIAKAEATKLNKDDLIARLSITPEDPDGDSNPDGDQGDDGTGDDDGDQGGDDEGGQRSNSTLPLETAPREEWVAAALERELGDPDEVEAMSTQEIRDLLS